MTLDYGLFSPVDCVKSAQVQSSSKKRYRAKQGSDGVLSLMSIERSFLQHVLILIWSLL